MTARHTSHGSMQRYRSIIDDGDAFQEAIQQPPVTTVRRNPIKAGPRFVEQLTERFPGAEQADWNPDVWRLRGVESPGKSVLYWRGEYYVQEESAAIPVTVLDPRPGERILDMAAAPGGKTTQIAGIIENDGVVVANEKNGKRMHSLHANVNRCGAASVVTTHYDGRNLPEEEYDRILVDAPCSGEADRARRGRGAADPGERGSLSTVQKGLCVKAARMLKPGGTMVYSTCTFAPEENEAVVQHVLTETDLVLEPVDLPVPHVAGVAAFDGQEFGVDMGDAVRVYPHHLDSGAMFIARFVCEA